MKLSEINQADIKVISEPKSRSVATPAKLKLSDIDPSQVKVIEDPGVIGKAIDTLERYGSAPMRAAYGAAQKGLLERGIPMDVVGGVKAAYEQFGADPSKAPTAAELVEQNPIGKVFSNKGVQEAFAGTPAGSAIKMWLLPFVGNERAKEISGKVPKKALEFLVGAETDPVSYVPGAVFEKPLVQGAKIVGKTAGALGKGGAYLAEQTTGIPRQVWANYGKRAKEIGRLAKDYVGESRYNQAFTDFRNTIGDAIAGRKNQLNEMIDKGLSGASRSSKIPVEPILKELDVTMRGLHPVTEASAINEIQGLKNIVRELAPEGKMSAWDTYKLQRYFHNRSMNAFAEGGQIFNPSSQAAKAAKSARYKTTELVNKLFPDTIKKANQEFVLLHNIDDIIPPSMLNPNASVAALRRAALDPNSKERKGLAQLSRFLHGDDRLVQGALDLATFEKTTNLPINPLSGGGTTSTSRTLLGGGVGLLGEASDDPQLKWAARGAGAMIASPALLKLAIDAGLTVPRTAKAIGGSGGLLEKGADKIAPVVSALEKRMQGAGRATKEFIKDEEGVFKPEELLKILKPGEENVFDLKKARGMAGEPKGLLPGEGGAPVAKYRPPLSSQERRDLLDWIDGAYNTLRRGEKFKPVDEQYLREVLPVAPEYQKNYVKDLLEQIEKQKNGGAEEIAKSLGGRPKSKSIEAAKQFTPGMKITDESGAVYEVIDNSNKGGLIMLRTPSGGTTFEYADDLTDFLKSAKETQGGLITNLEVERGPVKDGVTPSKPAPLILENGRPPELKDGTIVDLPNGKQVVVRGDYSHFQPGDGRVYWVEPSSAAGFERGASGKQFQISEREILGDKYKSYFDAKQSELEAGRQEYIDFKNRFETDRALQKTAEAERIQKGLIGVDFGGRGGKMPKTKTELGRERIMGQPPKTKPKGKPKKKK